MDVVIVKVDALEVPVWVSYVGGSNTDVVQSLAVQTGITDPFIYAAGNTISDNLPVVTNNGDYDDVLEDMDMLLLKLDNNGYREWLSYFGENGDDYANDVSIDNNGQVFIVGHAGVFAIPYFLAGAENTGPIGLECGNFAYLLMITDQNLFNWGTFIGLSIAGTDEATSVSCDAGGNVFVGGFTNDCQRSASMGPNNPPTQYYNCELFVKKYHTGTYAEDWQRVIGGEYADVILDVKPDNNGHVFACGYSFSPDLGTVEFDSGSLTDYCITSFGLEEKNAIICRFDESDGTCDWFTFYGGLFNDEATHLDVDSEGNLFVCGNTASADIDFPTSNPPNYYIQSTHNDNNDGSLDGFFLLFNPHTDLVWTSYFGQSVDPVYQDYSDDKIYSVFYTPDEKLYFCGSTNGIGWEDANLGVSEVIPRMDFDMSSTANDYYQPHSNSQFDIEGMVGYFDANLEFNTIGLKKVENNSGVFLFPKPASDNIYLRPADASSPVEIQVINALGQPCIKINEPPAATHNISISKLSPGCYGINIMQNGISYFEKFIKN